jgi:hypothetical protein
MAGESRPKDDMTVMMASAARYAVTDTVCSAVSFFTKDL